MSSTRADAAAQGAVGPSRQWLWALLSFAGWIAATAITFPVATLVPAGSLRTDIAAWIVLTAGVSVAVVLASGRAVFGTCLPVRPLAVTVPLIGVAVAVAEELLLHEWAEARFGHYDSELVWWTAALSGLVVATSIACFGTLVAPHGARLAPMVCQALATLAVAIVVASNLDGLRDGVRPESVPLATAVGLCGLYAVAATLGSWLIAWRAE